MNTGPDSPAIRANLAELGRRAAGKGCPEVLVAPDHTGRLNYHNCPAPPRDGHTSHYCKCGHTWARGETTATGGPA